MHDAVRPKRKTIWIKLLVGLAAAPTVAGVLGGILIAMALLVIEPSSTGANRDPLMDMLSLLLAAIFTGIVFCNLLSIPLILLGWAFPHFLTERRPVYFMASLAAAGGLFAYAFFGIGVSIDMPLLALAILAGVITGVVVGWLVSYVGYERVSLPHPDPASPHTAPR